jgi:hypothetical protein
MKCNTNVLINNDIMFDQNRSSIHQKKSDAWKIKTLDQLDEPGQITYM